MGNLKNIYITGLQKRLGAKFFFETGTWKGDGLAYAASSDFDRLYSSEVVADFASAATKRFETDKRVKIIAKDSITALKEILPDLSGNCIFWLDAHYPAADEGIANYNDETCEEIRLPLEQEVRLISTRIGSHDDILIMDDLRIYEDGPYQYGNIPENIKPPKNRDLKFVDALFGKTHRLIRSYKSEGYLFVLPKSMRNESFLERIFRISTGKII